MEELRAPIFCAGVCECGGHPDCPDCAGRELAEPDCPTCGGPCTVPGPTGEES